MPGDTTFESFEKELNRLVESFGNRITIEDKPEVRKAGGVYYTPRYIVDYIVEQAAGKLLDDIAGSATVPVAASGVAPDASETQIDLSDERVRRDAEHRARDARAPLKDFEQKTAALRLLDPASGSSSFLIRAFERVCAHWQKRLTFDLREVVGSSDAPSSQPSPPVGKKVSEGRLQRQSSSLAPIGVEGRGDAQAAPGHGGLGKGRAAKRRHRHRPANRRAGL